MDREQNWGQMAVDDGTLHGKCFRRSTRSKTVESNRLSALILTSIWCAGIAGGGNTIEGRRRRVS